MLDGQLQGLVQNLPHLLHATHVLPPGRALTMVVVVVVGGDASSRGQNIASLPC